MKRILCFGDSNTWGYIPGIGTRYGENIRYPKLLQKYLENGFEVIEDGLRGRNCGHDFEIYPRGNLNGSKTFPQSVLINDPLDYIVIMLGTNDLDEVFNSSAAECAKILQKKFIDFTREDLAPMLEKIPKFIIVAPNEMTNNAAKMKDGRVVAKSLLFNNEYKKLAEQSNCCFVDNSNLVVGTDGIHLTKESHKFLAKKIYECIKKEENI